MKNKYWFFRGDNWVGVLGIIFSVLVALLIFASLKYDKEHCTLWGCDYEDYAGEVDNQFAIDGSKDDLVSFSIKPGQEVSGKMKISGVVKGVYFFEGNIIIRILDKNKNSIPYGPGHANSTTDWMTAGPVSFEADFDFSAMPKGPAYIAIIQDDPRDASERGDSSIKEIFIPITIK